MPWIRGLGTATPPHLIEQVQAREFADRHFSRGRPDSARLLSVYDNALVKRRYSCVPFEWFASEHTFEERNDLFAREALSLSQDAVTSCLEKAELTASAIDHIVFLSSSGVSTPSLDAHLALRLGFKPQIRRTPVFGLGCAGGGAGLSLASLLARASPWQRVLLVSVELSSLTFQPSDFSNSNMVAAALFSDGAAAALIEGDTVASPRRVEVLNSLSVTLPNTLDVMGWSFRQTGLKVIFDRSIPGLVRTHFRTELEQFLKNCDRSLGEIEHWVLHPGGARILEAFRDVLPVPQDQLERSRSILENYGNMSAPTVLFILERLLESEPAPGLGVLASFGPGFSAEITLFRVHDRAAAD